MFCTSFAEISGQRIDAYYSKTEFTQFYHLMEKGIFEPIQFKDLIIDLKNGVEIRDYADKGFRYLRVTDLSKEGINDNSPRYVDVIEVPKRIKLNNDDLLISRSGSLGLVSIVEDKIIDAILSSHIFKISIDNKKVTSVFLQEFFRSSLGQFQFFKNNNGGVIPEINQSALKSILVPLPPIEKQNEIATHIQEIRQQAKQLQVEANQILQQTKSDIEKIILGV